MMNFFKEKTVKSVNISRSNPVNIDHLLQQIFISLYRSDSSLNLYPKTAQHTGHYQTIKEKNETFDE